MSSIRRRLLQTRKLKTDELVLRLDPVAVIGGHVRDENGDPVRHAQVTPTWRIIRGMNRVSRLLTSTSDDVGYFDFFEFDPRTYFVSVSATAVVWRCMRPPRQQATGAGYSGYRRRWMQPIRTPITAGATEAAGATPDCGEAGEHPRD